MEMNDITSMSRSYFTQCVGVILVYRKGDRSSLFELRSWVNRAQDSEWCGSIVLSLWSHDMGTDSSEVSPDLRDRFIDTVNIPKELVFEVNVAEEGRNVSQSYQQVVTAVHKKLALLPPPAQFQPTRGSVVLASTENEGNIQQASHSPKRRCFVCNYDLDAPRMRTR